MTDSTLGSFVAFARLRVWDDVPFHRVARVQTDGERPALWGEVLG